MDYIKLLYFAIENDHEEMFDLLWSKFSDKVTYRKNASRIYDGLCSKIIEAMGMTPIILVDNREIEDNFVSKKSKLTTGRVLGDYDIYPDNKYYNKIMGVRYETQN